MIIDDLVRSDLFRYSGVTTNSAFFKHFLRYSPGFTFTVCFRLVKKYGKYTLIGAVARLLYKKYTYKYGFQIPPTVKVGKGFLIMHFGHLVINSQAVIGDNCSIYHGVTIGATFKGANKGVPVIGNRVWVGAGAAIVGGITIGDNVLIAPNAYVNFSVPSNSIVIGNPGKLIHKDTATDGYLTNIVT